MEDNFFKDYTPSECIVEQLRTIKKTLKEDETLIDPMWNIVAGKTEETVLTEDEESTDDNNENVYENTSETIDNTSHYPSTQFYFTQTVSHFDKENIKQSSIEKCDIVECLCEGLERVNGQLDFSQLDGLAEEELLEVARDLERKLNVTGTYNLCLSMHDMDIDQRMRYSAALYSHVLLPKIITLEEPSRSLSLAIVECAKKFPDDVWKFIFIPLLNLDAKDPTIAMSIANALEPQKNTTLLAEFLEYTKELKSWHIPILQSLVSIKADSNTNYKFVRLFSEKALHFAKDKSFGKLVLSFIKINAPFLEEEKILLWEIANTHETLFKKPIQNILKNL